MESRRFLKAGVSVTGDLSRLQKALPGTLTPTGAVELANLARAKGLRTKTTGGSLADLAAEFLRCTLPKDVEERQSQSWSDDKLTDAQIQYAALDAWISLELYRVLSAVPDPPPTTLVEADIVAGLPVVVLSDDSTLPIARGYIIRRGTRTSSSILPDVVNGATLTPAKVLIQVEKVLVPSAKATEHQGRNLRSFDAASFELVVKLPMLRRTSYAPRIFDADGRVTTVAAQDASDEDLSSLIPPSEEVDLAPLSDEIDELRGMEDGLSEERSELDIGSLSRDPVAQQAADALGAPQAPAQLASRVLKDPFHVMHSIYVPKNHGCRRAFARAFSDAIFIPHAGDKRLLSARYAAQRPPTTFDREVLTRPSSVWSRCRRTIPAPAILVPRLSELFKTYGPLKDAETGKPLFDDRAWSDARKVLELASKGHMSDPVGIDLYLLRGKCGGPDGSLDDGVMLYRNARGTNSLEGGVHQNLRKRFPSYGGGVSARHADMFMRTYSSMHNLVVRVLSNPSLSRPDARLR